MTGADEPPRRDEADVDDDPGDRHMGEGAGRDDLTGRDLEQDDAADDVAHDAGHAGAGSATDVDAADDQAVDDDLADANAADDDLDHDAAMGEGVIVRCHNVSKWYGDVIAVNGLDLSLGAGITGLLGPNGAGKSTFLKMIMGLIRPSQGEIHVLGKEPWNDPGLLRSIGYVPESPAPWRDLSGREAALRSARLAGLPQPEYSVDAQLRRVGLSEAADKPVGAYSHGMQQRLKFAMALLGDPKLLILDEPLLGTDPMARRDLIRLLKQLAAEGKSIIISTHVLTDIEQLTQSIMLLHHGRLMAHGDVHHIRDLLDRYPRTIRVATSDPDAVGRRIWEMEGVLGIDRDAVSVTVRTDRPAEFFPALQAMLAVGDVPFSAITSPDDNVEAVFRYLVGAA